MQVSMMKPCRESVLHFSTGEPSWLQEKRLQAFDLFEKKDMPSFKYGLGVFAKLDFDLTETPIKKVILAPSTVEGIKLLSLSEALLDKELSEKIKRYWGALLPMNTKIDAFHYSFCDTLVILNEKDSCLNLHFAIEEFAAHHILIFVKENTKLFITEHVTGNGLRTNKVEIIVGKNATAEYTTLQNMEGGFVFSTKAAEVWESGSVKWFDVQLGADHAKSEIISDLRAPYAQAHIKSVFFGIHNQVFDMHTIVIHNASDTKSTIISKGCLDHHAKTVYIGLIDVGQNAPRSNGDQKEQTLLLSEDAEMDTLPDLVIHNHDVRCHHSASVGNLDSQTLFYLTSRGLNEKEAKRLLVSGFFVDIDDIQIQNMIQERLA